MTKSGKKTISLLALLNTCWLTTCFLSLGLSAPQLAFAKAEAQRGGLTTHRFKQDDYRRRFMLYTPATLRRSSNPKPLVLVIHGGAGTDRGMLKLTKRRWNHLADQHGFYVAYPNAVDRLWDFGKGKTSNELDHRVDDLAYFERVIKDISAKHAIDANRIFATGISRGGQASYFLACKLPTQIRAVMPVAMGLPEHLRDDCTAGSSVALAVMNGTADPQVPYDGGQVTVFRQKRDFVLSAKDTLSLWRARNGCSATPTLQKSIVQPGDRTSVEVTEWSDCQGDPVLLYQVNNGGHTWPSGIPYLPARIVGEVSQDIDAADEAWAFFSRF